MVVSLKKLLATLSVIGFLTTSGLNTTLAQETPPPKKSDAPPAAAENPKPHAPAQPSVTTGTVTSIDGQHIDYTATAAYMPLNDEQGKLRANIFYTAYIQGLPEKTPATQPATTNPQSSSLSPQSSPTPPAADHSKRPITFVFNGGPGAASVWLHLGAVGPRRLDIPADGTAPAVPFKVVENPYTWLPATDLVFVDPVNTGFSRAATPEQAKEFLGVREDVAGMGEFIRLYLTKTGRWDSPLFLAGESYGTTRASYLADHLQERVGVSVSGVILISTVLNFATLSPSEANDLPFPLYLPSYAAVAWYHKKLDMTQHADLNALLKDAEAFASGPYVSALAKGASLPQAERQAIAEKIAGFTSLSVPYILESNLRIPPRALKNNSSEAPTAATTSSSAASMAASPRRPPTPPTTPRNTIPPSPDSSPPTPPPSTTTSARPSSTKANSPTRSSPTASTPGTGNPAPATTAATSTSATTSATP